METSFFTNLTHSSLLERLTGFDMTLRHTPATLEIFDQEEFYLAIDNTKHYAASLILSHGASWLADIFERHIRRYSTTAVLLTSAIIPAAL